MCIRDSRVAASRDGFQAFGGERAEDAREVLGRGQGRAEGEEGTGDPGERSLADVAV